MIKVRQYMYCHQQHWPFLYLPLFQPAVLAWYCCRNHHHHCRQLIIALFWLILCLPLLSLWSCQSCCHCSGCCCHFWCFLHHCCCATALCCLLLCCLRHWLIVTFLIIFCFAFLPLRFCQWGCHCCFADDSATALADTITPFLPTAQWWHYCCFLLLPSPPVDWCFCLCCCRCCGRCHLLARDAATAWLSSPFPCTIVLLTPLLLLLVVLSTIVAGCRLIVASLLWLLHPCQCCGRSTLANVAASTCFCCCLLSGLLHHGV